MLLRCALTRLELFLGLGLLVLLAEGVLTALS